MSSNSLSASKCHCDWKHEKATLARQRDVEPVRIHKSTGQRDEVTPMEASLVQGRTAREARRDVYAQCISQTERDLLHLDLQVNTRDIANLEIGSFREIQRILAIMGAACGSDATATGR